MLLSPAAAADLSNAQNATRVDLRRQFGFLGSVGTLSSLPKGGRVYFASISASGRVEAHYGPSPYLLENYRNL